MACRHWRGRRRLHNIPTAPRHVSIISVPPLSSRRVVRRFVLNPESQVLTLHVTNGDGAASGLTRSGLPGDILSWRDILHDGPVPCDDDLQSFRATRAEFLATRGWASVSDVVADLAARDTRLNDAGVSDEVVLWFEPDLFDQLQLMQVLGRLGSRAASHRPRVTIAPADCFLEPLTPDKFVPLYNARRIVTATDIAHGTDAWRAFTSPSPMDLATIADRLDASIGARTYSANTDARLPHLAAALRRQLEEFPDAQHGLSRTERQICEALYPGQLTLAKLFQTSSQASESWAFLGDWSFAWYTQRLSDCLRPLVMHANNTRVVAPVRDADGRGFWERSVILTPFGQEVVRERADAIEENGIDRWIGGTHLTSAWHWRWDGSVHHLVERSQ